MSKALLPVVALACLIVGGVAGFLIGQTGEPPPRMEPTPWQPEPAPQVELPAPLPSPAAPESSPEIDFRAALQAVDYGDVPTGKGTITGRVATAEGEAVAGVKVLARLAMPPSRYTFGEGPIEDELEDHVRRRLWQEMGSREALTDEQGNYKLERLDPLREYQLSGQHESYIVEPAQSGAWRRSAGDIVNFRATPATPVEVTLLFENGSPVPDGLIDLHGTGTDGRGISSGGRAYAAPSVRLVLRPGKWVISGRHGPGGLFGGEAEIETKAGDAPRQLEIRLEGKSVIRGVLNLPELYIGQRCMVYLQPDPPAADPEPDMSLSGLKSTLVDIRSTQETFRFNELEAGKFRLLVTLGFSRGPFSDATRIAAWDDVPVGTGVNEAELTLPEPDRASFIVTRVFSPDGAVLTDVSFSLVMRAENGGSSGSTQPLRAKDGSFWLRRDTPDPDWGGSLGNDWWYVVTAMSTTYGRKEARYERGDTHELEIRYVEPARLTLLVPGWEEQELRNEMRWSIVAPEAPGETPPSRRMRGNNEPEDAPFRFGPMEPGEYDVVLMLNVSERSRRELVRQRVQLPAGETSLSVPVPRLHSVTVHVPDDVPVRYLSIWPRDTRPTAGRRSDNIELALRDGRATVSHLAPGSYRLQGDIGEMQFTVPANGEILFDPPRYNALLLYNIKPGGRIEGLGLRNNDLLIAINGEPVLPALAGASLYNYAQEKPNATWTIQRGGVTLELAIDGAALQRFWREGESSEKERIWTSSTYR